MRLKHVVSFLLIALIVAPVLAQDNVPTTESVSCWMELSEGLEEGTNVDCGYLIVPEDRNDPSSPTIKLAFAVLYDCLLRCHNEQKSGVTGVVRQYAAEAPRCAR